MDLFRKIIARAAACAMLLPLTGCGMFSEVNAGNDLGVQTGTGAQTVGITPAGSTGTVTSLTTLPVTTTTTTTTAPKKPDISV